MLTSTLVIGASPLGDAVVGRRWTQECRQSSDLNSPRQKLAPPECRNSATVRQASASAAQAELVHFAVERRAGHIEVPGGLRNVAAGTGERPLQNGPFRRLDPIVFAPPPADQIGGRDRPCELLRADAERKPRGP